MESDSFVEIDQRSLPRCIAMSWKIKGINIDAISHQLWYQPAVLVNISFSIFSIAMLKKKLRLRATSFPNISGNCLSNIPTRHFLLP
jgi:hypothetical protein